MTLRAHREQLKGGRASSFSPPAWKDQLKQRCMQRLRQDRHLLLAKLRSPDATRSVADEMKRLVYSEEQQRDIVGVPYLQQQQQPPTHLAHRARFDQHPQRHPVFDLQHDYDTDDTDDEDAEMAAVAGSGGEAYASIEELVAAGELSESDYLEIVHALEDELLAELGDEDEQEQQEQLVEQMVEFEEASLEAMLAGLDLSVPDDFFDDEFDICDAPSRSNNSSNYTNAASTASDAYVLCPICKVGCVREIMATQHFPLLVCTCGFSFQTQHEPLHGALQDFQETVAAAFMAHREQCYADPSFSKARAGSSDAIRIECRACRTSELLS